MIPIKVKDIAAALKAELIAGDPEAVISSVSVDSRSIAGGALFVPLKGERFDGHRFIEIALDAGAGGFLAEEIDPRLKRRLSGTAAVALKVSDTQTALGELANLVRGRLSTKVIGITGSTGKTSTRDILTALTGGPFKTQASIKNYNNEIGVPLTITKAKAETEILIVEMGMRGEGQIASLAAMAQPDIAIVTNVGLTHVGILGSQEKIADAKAELVAALPPEGYAVLNHDDDWTQYLRGRTRATVVTFGLKPGADVSAAEITFDEYARPSWRLVRAGSPGPVVKLSAAGRHNVINALAAIAAAELVGVAEKDIIEGLGRVRLTDMRLAIAETKSGLTIIDDAYNANPASMTAALEVLMQIKPASRHIAVLGRMSELGEASAAAHRAVGAEAAKVGLDMLVAIGEEAGGIAESAVEAGLAPAVVSRPRSKSEAVAHLKAETRAGDVVLVKGSRVAGLEEVVAALIKEK